MGTMKKWLLRAHVDTERQRLAKRMEDQAAHGYYSCPLCGDFRFDVMARDLKGYETTLAFLDGEDVARTDLVQAHRTLYKRRLAMAKVSKRTHEELGTKYEESTREKAFKQIENKIARYLAKEDKR